MSHGLVFRLLPYFADMQHKNAAAILVSLHRQLEKVLDSRERQFLAHSFQTVSTLSAQHVSMEDWMVTSYEVDFGPSIGSGGLYVFWCFHICTLPDVNARSIEVDKCSKGHGMVQRLH